MRHLFFILIACLCATVSSAQNATPSSGMTFFSDQEHQILLEQSALLRWEEETDYPIWIKDSNGVMHIIDGTELSTRLEGFATITQLMGLEGWALDEMGFLGEIVRQQTSEGVRADIIQAQMMNDYVANSALNRNEAMRAIERRLEFVRAQFLKELDIRNEQLGVAGDNLDISGDSHPCLQQYLPSERRFYMRRGNWNWVQYVEHAGYYCEIPNVGWDWDADDYGFAQIAGDFIAFTLCSEGQCHEIPQVFYANIANEGDVYMAGLIYNFHDDIAEGHSVDTFSWWQCSPAANGVEEGASGSCIGK